MYREEVGVALSVATTLGKLGRVSCVSPFLVQSRLLPPEISREGPLVRVHAIHGAMSPDSQGGESHATRKDIERKAFPTGLVRLGVGYIEKCVMSVATNEVSLRREPGVP